MEEDEVAICRSSTWESVEGSLEELLRVSREKNYEEEEPKLTSKLVLVPPSEASGPCELTVAFEQGLYCVHQIYVLSSARICEIYNQKEQNGDFEYVCTVRGDLVTASEAKLPQKTSKEGQSWNPGQPKELSGAYGAAQFSSASISEVKRQGSLKEDTHQSFSSKEDIESLFGEWKDDGLLAMEYPSRHSRDSEEESFQSLSEEISGRMVGGIITFDETLDQTEWVECPHSPMKSSAAGSDDEVEADMNKCGFFLVDADSEAQHTKHSRISLMDRLGNSAENACLQDEASEREPGQHCSGQSFSKEEGPAEESITDTTLYEQDISDQNPGQNQNAKESSQWPGVPSDQEIHHHVQQISSGTEVDRFEVNDKQYMQSSMVDSNVEGDGCQDPFNTPYKVAESTKGTVNSNGNPKKRLLYQCSIDDLVSSERWTSVRIRFLSLEEKSQLEVYKATVTIAPGPPELPQTMNSGPFASLQQSAGSSSLMAMLVPGILQMARGLSEERKQNALSCLSAERERRKAEGSPSPDSISPSLPVLGSELPKQHLALVGAALSSDARGIVQTNVPVEENENSAVCAKDKSAWIEEDRSTGVGFEETVTTTGDERESVVQSESSKVIESKGRRSNQQEDLESSGYFKDKDGVNEMVQRLDRLEAICLRMENSLNFALENMDRRLKVLESGGVGRGSVTGQPFWGGTGFDSGAFVSATSVNAPTVQTEAAYCGLDAQTNSYSEPADLQVGQSAVKSLSSRAIPFYPGLFSSTSPSSLSSVSPSLPLWPLTSPQRMSPKSKSCASSINNSTLSKDPPVNQLNEFVDGREAGTNPGDTYWETQSSDNLESDMSSSSEHTSYGDDSEDPGSYSCPESVSSSPAKPAKLVDHALKIFLSAFSASCETTCAVGAKDQESLQSKEEDSFAGEEQAPLVDLDCYSLGDQDEVTHESTAEVFMQGYEAIPLSSEKEIYTTTGKFIPEAVFWSCENDVLEEINWQDEGLQTQEEIIYFAQEDYSLNTEKGSPGADASDRFTHNSENISTFEFTGHSVPLRDTQGILQEDVKEAVDDDHSEAILRTLKQDLLANPFLQESAAAVHGCREGELQGELQGETLSLQSSWEEEWTKNQHQNGQKITVMPLTVRSVSKSLDAEKETLLQEDVFPDDWNWFASGVSPQSSMVDDSPSPERILSGKEALFPDLTSGTWVDPPMIHEIDLNNGNDSVGPRSLLDEDVAIPTGIHEFQVEVYSKEWIGQKNQWSLLDEDLPIPNGVEFQSEEGCPDDWFGHREQRSLIDDDISSPPINFSGGNPLSSSPEQQYSLSGIIKHSKSTDVSVSPSSQASRSNPFEDDYDEGVDLTQERQKQPLVLLEEFGQDVLDIEVAQSVRPQSLLFHLSL